MLWHLLFLGKKTLWRLSLFGLCRWCWWWYWDVCCWEKTTACVVTFARFGEPITPPPPLFWVFTMQLGPLKSPFLPAVWAEHTWKSFEWFWFWQNKAQWTASLVKTAINFSCSCQCFNRSVRICAMYGKIDECINTAVIHILWCLKLLLVMEPTDRTSGLELLVRIGSGRTKTCTKCSERCDKQLCENLWVQKQIFLQFSSNHSKYSKNTFYMLKASFWYLNQPDWTSGIGFFTQIRLRQIGRASCRERV